MAEKSGKRMRGPHPFSVYLSENFWSYQKFRQEEGVPIIEGHFVGNVANVELAGWERMGGLGTLINLGGQEIDDAYVVEIAPGQSLTPQKHLFEEIIYVAEGRGATTISQGTCEPFSFEWQQGSLFAIPLNARYQHHNGDGSTRARLLGFTNAPVMINMFHSRDFTFNCPYEFTDRFEGTAEEFEKAPELLEEVPGTLYETNFVADVRALALTEWQTVGRGVKHTYLALSASVMKVHIAEFAVGTYKKAHRHGAGAHIIILDGEGYTLMWRPGEEPRRYDWEVGSLISPPAGWFHQHFNTGPTPVLHLAVHRPATIFEKSDRGEIAYEDEDPAIYAGFAAELAKNGVGNAMPNLARTATETAR